MVKRVVDTDFWTDKDVIDNYSPEDKFFYLYLITNGKSTQVGIYELPIKVIGFETGYSTDAIQVLIDRFSNKYGQIVYSQETQEVSVINSLQFSILKGGRPVTDLLVKELANVNDTSLIQDTYNEMLNFWELSKRPYDKTIKKLFEEELANRGVFSHSDKNESNNENTNESNNDINNESKNDINNEINNESKNDNHNEESWATNRGTNRNDVDEKSVLERYSNILKKYNPTLEGTITPSNIVKLYYQEMFGDVPKYVDTQLKNWEKDTPRTLVLEALSRSIKATHPLPYAGGILANWEKSGVKTYEDVIELDKKFSQ